MAFASKFTSFMLGLRAIPEGSRIASRNFHMITKPLTSPTIQGFVSNTAANVALPAAPVTGLQKLLAPFNAILTQVAGFKVKGRLKRRCKDCYFVIRQQRHYVICPTHPRHKQMSMKKRDYKSWILTHATQSKERPY